MTATITEMPETVFIDAVFRRIVVAPSREEKKASKKNGTAESTDSRSMDLLVTADGEPIPACLRTCCLCDAPFKDGQQVKKGRGKVYCAECASNECLSLMSCPRLVPVEHFGDAERSWEFGRASQRAAGLSERAFLTASGRISR